MNISFIKEASHLTTLLNRINPSFSGHETFPFRYTWLKKGIDAVRENPTGFMNNRATITLGVGKNMVRSIRHWCLTARLIEEDESIPNNRGRQLAPTQLGEAIFADDGFDPYLEDVATLWLIHWQITTNTNRATTWFWAFNLFNQNEFTRDRFTSELLNWTEKAGWNRISENSIKRDVECFFRTYVPSRLTKAAIMEDTFDCPIAELDLISELSDRKTYRFHRGAKPSLPNDIFAATLSEFWESYFPEKETLAFSEIAYSPNSPGRVFKLDSDTLVAYLEALEELTDGAFFYDETAGLKQVYRREKVDSMKLLERYYASSLSDSTAPQSIGADSMIREVL